MTAGGPPEEAGPPPCSVATAKEPRTSIGTAKATGVDTTTGSLEATPCRRDNFQPYAHDYEYACSDHVV